MKRIAVLFALLVAAGCGGGDSAPEPSGPFDYDRTADLELRDEGRANRRYPIEIRNVSYRSPGTDSRVSAYLLRPPGKGPYPGMILLHGAGADRQQLVLQASWLAGRGAVAVVVDSPFAREPDLEIPDGTAGLRVERDLIVRTVVELRRAVDLLQEEPQVDDERIGFLGYSAGARVGAILAGNEDRIKAYDLIAGGSPPLSELTRSAPPETRVEVEEILTDVDPLRHIRNAAPAKLLFQNGRRDEFVPRAALLAMYRAASEPKEIRWYDATHEPTPALYRDSLAWLTRELGLRNRPIAKGVIIGPP